MPKENETTTPPAIPRPSATVMLVRDASVGVEVFLMKRSMHGMFGGLHVFPGGKVDSADHTQRWNSMVRGVDDASASSILGLESGGLSYWVACIRECFEEAGILLAIGPDQSLPPFKRQEVRERYAAWRARLNANEDGALESMCKAEHLQLAADQLAYVSHWITPITEPKRFSTRFFVARAPSEQKALHDGFETVDSHWIRPEDALDRFDQGEINLISPTFKNLQAISGFTSTEALLSTKRSIAPATIPTILPRIITRDSKGFDEILDVVGYGGRLD